MGLPLTQPRALYARDAAYRYGVATVVTVVALLLRGPLQSVVGDGVPFVLLFPAVILSSWLGGRGPGLLSTALGALGALIFDRQILAPYDVSDGIASLRLLTFVVVGVFASWVCGRLVEARQLAQKNAELARANEARLQFVTDAAPVLISYIDLDHVYRFNNRAYETWFGLESRQLKGRHMRDVLGDSAYDAVLPHVAAALRGELVSYEGTVPYRDGGSRHIRAMYIPDVDDDGTVDGIVAVVVDISDLERAQRQLEDERALLAAILGQMPVGVVIADTATSRPIITNEHAKAIPAAALEGEEGPLARALRDGEEIVGKEIALRSEDGSETVIQANAGPIRDRGGAIVAAAVTFMDVTDRRRTDEELRLSEVRYRTLAESVPLLMWTNSEDGAPRFFNRHWLEYTGVGDADPATIEWASYIHLDDLARMVETREEAIPRGEPYEWECRLRRADGAYRWHLARVVPLVHDGRVAQWIGTATDIHDMKLATERDRFRAMLSDALATTLDYNEMLLSLASAVVPTVGDWCGIHIKQNDGRIELVAQRGDVERAALVKEISERYPIDASHENDPVAAALRTGESLLVAHVAERELASVARDPYHLELLRRIGATSTMIVPLTARGRRLGVLSIVSTDDDRHFGERDLALARDLAYRAALASDNARLLREAQEANRAKDEFLAIVSHELRTPLNAILGWSRLLSSGALDEQKGARAVAVIERNAVSQAQLIDDLLDVSRIVANKLKIDRRPMDLAASVDAAVESSRPDAEAKGVRVEARIRPIDAAYVGDAERIEQVTRNLISNAIKFTPAGGEVEVSFGREGDHAVLVVADTGRGIEPQFLPRVFDAFRQADSSSTRSHGGLGLGLAIVKRIVRLHGGSVHAESDGLDSGARFVVRLPLAAGRGVARQLAVPKATASPSDTALEGLRVLAVDDDADTREVLAEVLRGGGADVRVASSAAEALEVLSSWVPEVLVSDIGMPIADGYDLLREVRRRPAEEGGAVPAIALTAYARDTDRLRAMEAGFELHVAKPVNPQALLEAVASLVRGAKNERVTGTGLGPT